MTGPASLTLPIPAGQHTLQLTARVPETITRDADVRFEIQLDGHRIARTPPLRRGRSAQPFAVDLADARTVTLRITTMNRPGDPAVGIWQNIRFSPSPAPAPTPTPPDDSRWVADTSVQHELFLETTNAGRPDRRPYMLSLPEPADAGRAADRTYPMIVYMHGIAAGGDDHRDLYIEALPRIIRDDPAFTAREPFIFLNPQAQLRQRFMSDDMTRITIEMIEHVRETYPVDPERIYLTGFSDGAIATWRIAAHRPDLFAAIAPISGRIAETGWPADQLSQVPAWIAIGALEGERLDNAFQMAVAYNQARVPFYLDAVPHFTHVIWEPCYRSPELYDWLAQWRRGLKRSDPPYAGLPDPADADREPAALLKLWRIHQYLRRDRTAYARRSFEQLSKDHPDTLAGHVAARQHAAMSDDLNTFDAAMDDHNAHAAREMFFTAMAYEAQGQRRDAIDELQYLLRFYSRAPHGREARRQLREWNAD